MNPEAEARRRALIVDEELRRLVRSKPCAAHGHPDHTCIGRTECDHVKTTGSGGRDRNPDGTGNLWPACHQLHIHERHRFGLSWVEERYGLNATEIARRLGDEALISGA